MGVCPQTSDLQDKAGIPFGWIVQPFAFATSTTDESRIDDDPTASSRASASAASGGKAPRMLNRPSSYSDDDGSYDSEEEYESEEESSEDVAPPPRSAGTEQTTDEAAVNPLPLRRLPVVSFPGGNIIRCRSCRTYINPFVTWGDNGRKWKCNICLVNNDTPGDYLCSLGPDGQRLDVQRRPELRCGAVEFIASSNYMVRPPMPPVFVFVVEVTSAAIASGAASTALSAIAKSVEALRSLPRAKVGIVTFDSALHFYEFRHGGRAGTATMRVVVDVESPFAPAPTDLLCAGRDPTGTFRKLLRSLARRYAAPTDGTTVPGVSASAFGAASKAAFSLVKRTGGRIVSFISSRPTLGVGALDDRAAIVSDPNDLLRPPPSSSTGGQFYKELALEMSRYQVAMDLYFTPPAGSSAFLDVAGLSPMVTVTGGAIHHFAGFRADRDALALRSAILRVTARVTGWEAVLRVRCSKGLVLEAQHGHFFVRAADLLALPTVDSDSTFAVQVRVEDLSAAQSASLQAALLYTTSKGERRIRVFTVALPICTTLAPLYRSVDGDAVAALTAKMAAKKALDAKVADAREALSNKLVDVLSVYRASFSTPQTPPSQLVLPDALRSYPLHTLGIIKHPAFRAGADVDADRRVALMAHLRTGSVDAILSELSPRLFDLQQVPDSVADTAIVPPTLNLSSEKLTNSTVYVLHAGTRAVVWLGRGADPQLLGGILGDLQGRPLDANLVAGFSLPRLPYAASVRLNGLLDALALDVGRFVPVSLVLEGDPAAAVFSESMVEDRSGGAASYFEFLVAIQKQIQEKVKR
jgi:protein transport protein SEC24